MIKVIDKAWIKTFLKNEDEIATLHMVGAINNVDGSLFSNPKDQVVIYVDSLENPMGVIVQEHEYWHYIYAKNDDFVLQAKREYFDQLEEYGIDACNKRAYDLLIDDREMEWEEHCKLLYLDPVDYQTIDYRYKLSKGTISDTDVINDHYTYKDEYSRVFIEDGLRHRPSIVYREKEEPLAWVLTHRDDSIGIMYTKEEYRGKGMAYELSMAIAGAVIEAGRIPFIHIATGNQASFKLAEKCGYKFYQDIYWFGIKNKIVSLTK